MRVSRVAPAPAARRRYLPLALAASVLLVTGIALWIGMNRPDAQELRTGIGEVRLAVLPDGSRVDLGADSHVVAHYSERGRELRLTQGRAFFTVMRDPARPFIVHTGEISVTAVGTAFDVRKGLDDTIVTVGEGRVRISAQDGPRAGKPLDPVHADAGQRVSYSKPAHALTLKQVDPQLTQSWRRGVLQFQEEPLRDVVDEVSRYLQRRIVLGDAQLGRVPFTGTISPERMDDWFIALEKILPVTVERDADEIRIRRHGSAFGGG